MNGAKIIEIGLKALVWMIDAGFLLACITFIGGGIMVLRSRKKPELNEKSCFRSILNGTKEDESTAIGCFILAILSGIITVILFGLAIMPWWA